MLREVRLWRDADRRVKKELGGLRDESRRYFMIRCIIDDQVRDVVQTTEALIAETGVNSADEARLFPKPLVQYSPLRQQANLQLRDYLYKNLYFNPAVHEPNQGAVQRLEALFHFYLENHDEIGDQSRQRARKEGWHRAICDYLSGMSDRYAILEHQRLLGLNI